MKRLAQDDAARQLQICDLFRGDAPAAGMNKAFLTPAPQARGLG
jgi:hypothetical protein